MPRTARHKPLLVRLNNRPVGHLLKQNSGAIEFGYHRDWLDWPGAIPVSLSLPLREDIFRGEVVSAVFENLLPDSDGLRRRVAERVGAGGIDAYSLLSAIGRDCVGALQFSDPDSPSEYDSTAINGETVSESEIEAMLQNLARAPLGLDQDQDFRLSLAGAQEKTALLWHNGHWLKPRGTTPTTHIFKTRIGQLPNGIDLSNSIENEYYCLKLAEAFGLPVNHAEIHQFGDTKALVIERFDRRWTADGRLLRLPQEDCCQALSVPPTRKYQSEGGPGMADILELLKGSDRPAEDQAQFLKSQILFWLIGATDGHAKNFSIFLGPGGRFSLTPLYDILTAQPGLAAGQIRRNQMKLAMSVGNNRHYRIDEISARHFQQTAKSAGLPVRLVNKILEETFRKFKSALQKTHAELPAYFPEDIHLSTHQNVNTQAQKLATQYRKFQNQL